MTSLSDFRCALQNPEFPNGISHIRCHRTVFPSGKFGISVIPTTGEHHMRLGTSKCWDYDIDVSLVPISPSDWYFGICYEMICDEADFIG